MTTDQMPEFDHELVFDPTESGSAPYSYYSLVTDYGSPADILIRVENSKRVKEPWEKAEHLAKEVVKRWNAHTRPAPTPESVEALKKEIEEAMNEEWSDWCSDTGHFPDDFNWKGGNGILTFTAGKWASHVADNIIARLTLASTSRLHAKPVVTEAKADAVAEAMKAVADHKAKMPMKDFTNREYCEWDNKRVELSYDLWRAVPAALAARDGGVE